MAFVQAANSGNAQWAGGNHTTVALTFGAAVTSGNSVAGHVTFDASVNSISTVTDDKGNVYTTSTATPIPGDSQGHTAFYRTNITNAPTVVTVNFSGLGCSFTFSQADEYSGVSAIDVAEGRAQTAPGATTDAVSSSVAGTPTTVVNDLVVGMYLEDTGADASFTAGTGFTKRDTGADGSSKVVLGIEDKTQATIAATRATFTVASGTGHYSTIMLAFKPSGGAVAQSIDNAAASLPGTIRDATSGRHMAVNSDGSINTQSSGTKNIAAGSAATLFAWIPGTVRDPVSGIPMTVNSDGSINFANS